MSETAVLESPAAVVPPSMPPNTRLGDLILVRLLTAPKGVPPKKLREELAVFSRRSLTTDEIASAVTALRAEGFITAKGTKATEAGQAKALQTLGLASLPPGTNWGILKAKYLLPKSLGLSGPPTEIGNQLGGDKLAVLLLKRKIDLPVGTGNTLNAVLEAIACRELGYPDNATLKELLPWLFAKAVGSDSPLDKDAAKKVVPTVLLNAKRNGVAALRDVALGGWLDSETPALVVEPKPVEPEESFDLEMFANTVRYVAKKCPTGWFGDNKVFINHVWEQLKADRPFAAMGFDGFKQRLVEANQSGRLTLSRADLVQLMDPEDVRVSEIAYLTATFHFILVERD